MKSEAFANMSLEEQAAKRTAELAAWAKVMQPVVRAQRTAPKKQSFLSKLFKPA